MLPFLKNKLEASTSAPVESIERKPDEDKEYDPLESAVEDFCHAIKADDYAAGAAALRAAFELLESQPHEENNG